MDEHDKRVIACNYSEPAKVAACGALAYVRWPNLGSGNERIPLLVRSRGGRWIEKWEAMHRLENFRFKTIPPGHPLYGRVTDYVICELGEDDLRLLREACAREHAITREHPPQIRCRRGTGGRR